MPNVMLDGFSLVLVMMYRYLKSRFYKCVFIVDIPTQILFAILLFIDCYFGVNWKFISVHSYQRETIYDKMIILPNL